jgi:hypothetical protein
MCIILHPSIHPSMHSAAVPSGLWSVSKSASFLLSSSPSSFSENPRCIPLDDVLFFLFSVFLLILCRRFIVVFPDFCLRRQHKQHGVLYTGCVSESGDFATLFFLVWQQWGGCRYRHFADNFKAF